MRHILITAAGLALFSSSAFAQDVDDLADADETEQSEESDIVVTGEIDEDQIERCRYVPITGTRFRERICMTQNELDEQVRNTRELSEDLNNAGAAPFQDDIIDALPEAPGG